MTSPGFSPASCALPRQDHADLRGLERRDLLLCPVRVEDMFAAYNERRTVDITDNLGK